MYPAHSFETVQLHLRTVFDNFPCEKLMIGILFSRPGSSAVEKAVLNNIARWHHRSSHFMHLFCAGFGGYWPPNLFPDQRKVATVDRVEWSFSDIAFNSFLEEIEATTRYRYSGEVDLVLINAGVDRDSGTPFLDFRDAICLNLEDLIRNGQAKSVGHEIEQLFRYAKDNPAASEVWQYSNKVGIQLLGKTMRSLLHVVYNPSSVAATFKTSVEAALNYRVIDISIK